MQFKSCIPFAALIGIFLATGASVSAQSVAEMRQKAVQFLEVTQAADGSWTNSDAVGITGLVTTAILRSGVEPGDPMDHPHGDHAGDVTSMYQGSPRPTISRTAEATSDYCRSES